MRFSDYKDKDILEVNKEALNKAKDAQSKLNSTVTFIDVEEQCANVKDGKLKGIPVVLKDNVSTKGIRTTASSRMLDNYVPVYDATIVKKLRDAGAVFIAKSSLDELGMGGTNLTAYTGKVNNPWDLNRISGGSSGGSAVMVASGIVPLAIGTDTGDSVRKPASFNNVVGVKPTYGRISRYGIIPYASSLDHVGYFTTNVKDAARTLEVLAGRDDKDLVTSYKEVENYEANLNSDVKGKRIGIIKNVTDAIENQQILNDFNELCDKLKEKGAIVEYVEFDSDLLKTLVPTYYVIANAEATANHASLDGIRFGVQEDGENLEEIMTNSRTKGFSFDVRKRFVIGGWSLDVENQDRIFRKAQKVRRLIVNALNDIIKDYDALMVPASGGGAPLPSDDSDELSHSHLIAENHMLLGNFSGYPSMTVPHTFVDGLPVGVNLLSKAFEEQTMFNIALAIEEVCDAADKCKEV